jgi:pimeloyl-ACP methyl ester carboxylesterase
MYGLARLLLMPVLLAVSTTDPARADAGRLGVVLLHGKQSAPEEHGPLGDTIAGAGHPLERPEMCWSGRRIYDRPYLECLQEIDAAIGRLGQRGAVRIVLVGHSLGANGALGYGARHKLAGVAALAPGHLPEVLAGRLPVAESLERARRLLAAAHRARTPFADFNGDLAITVMATPETYLSFFSADSPAVMPANAARLQAPLLYVVGTGDPFQRGPDYIFAKAPPRPLNRHAAVHATHFGTSAAAAEIVVSWLRAVAAAD